VTPMSARFGSTREDRSKSSSTDPTDATTGGSPAGRDRGLDMTQGTQADDRLRAVDTSAVEEDLSGRLARLTTFNLSEAAGGVATARAEQAAAP
jgi:hypothetical protein